MMMTKMISKTLTAGVLCTSLALTSLTPTQARAEISQSDAIVGIMTLLFLGAAIHNNRDRDDPPARVQTRPTQIHPTPARPARPAQTRNWRVLPADCVRNVTRRNGNVVRLFTQRCLNNSYAHVNRLPQACHAQVRTADGGMRQGFRARCLRNQGFRTNRR